MSREESRRVERESRVETRDSSRDSRVETRDMWPYQIPAVTVTLQTERPVAAGLSMAFTEYARDFGVNLFRKTPLRKTHATHHSFCRPHTHIITTQGRTTHNPGDHCVFARHRTLSSTAAIHKQPSPSAQLLDF